MTQYTTQMDAARHGIITPQMEIVAEKEHFDVEELRELIAKGQVIIPCNKNHKCISPSGVGAKLTTKINVNLGVSRDWKDVEIYIDLGSQFCTDTTWTDTFVIFVAGNDYLSFCNQLS